MRTRHLVFVILTAGLLVIAAFAQVGRGGSQWLTAMADAQRTSWVRNDDKISVATMSKSGFQLHWRVKLENEPRGVYGLVGGVTASGVTLFVPMSIVTGSANNVYAIDNDIGYVVWQRHFDAQLPAPTPSCAGGITSAGTRIVKLDASATASGGGMNFDRPSAGYRSLLGEPGEGAPVEGRGGRASTGDPSAATPPVGAGARGTNPAGGAARGAAPGAPPAAAGRGAPAAERIPGAPRGEEGGFGRLGRPSGVSYVISSDGMLHVLGLPSGKDIQRPAPFLPANARWSAPVAVDTMMYAATSGNCGGAPDGVWAIDLDSDAKPVVSWKTDGAGVVGAVALTTNGTLIAAIGPGQTTGDGKSNAIVALDPKTLQLKDWFAQSSTEFATGPTILRDKDKDLVAAATKDGRILLLDAASLGGSDHATPLFASKPFSSAGGSVSGDALAAWQQTSAPAQTSGTVGGQPAQSTATSGPSWILLPIRGRPSIGKPDVNGPVSSGAVVALKLVDNGTALSLETAWVSHDLSAPATPIIVNGVVFAVATGMPSTPNGQASPAILHAYEGATGKRLWSSGKTMATFASPGSIWSGLGQVYVGGHDGTLYAFGFNDERRPTNTDSWSPAR
jgi:hypothetical protein